MDKRATIVMGMLALGSFGLGRWIVCSHPIPTVAVGSEIDPADAAMNQFRWHGKPIHPGVIHELSTDLSDNKPVIAAVDLEGACESQRFAESPKSRNGFLFYEETKESGDGAFGYKYLGHSSDGKHVLLTTENSGGSGIFEDILIVKFSHTGFNDDGRLWDRVQMTLVGHFTLGDRDDGKVEVHNDQLFIGRSRYREADKTISLIKLNNLSL